MTRALGIFALLLACSATSVRKIRSAIVARYSFRFEQDGAVVYEGDHSAIFTRVGSDTARGAAATPS